jgi:hypothetical protein
VFAELYRRHLATKLPKKGYMKQRILVVLLACAAITVSSPQPARAQVDISANVDIQIGATSDFYQPLDQYGTWVDIPQYGRCFRPRGIETDWQPYTVGHWEWTDAGWYWVSDEPWGWACFHYGSWDHDPRYGWCWIPGTDWAPAWVTWRYSDDYIGWAPCGPGLSVLAPSFFTFCNVHNFRDHFNRRNLIVNNTTIINRTKVVKNFQRQTVDFNGHQRTVFANRGPGVDPIQRATGRTFTPRPIRDVVRESHTPDRVRQGNDRPNAPRPEQQRREATPSPTGREQQRNYQQQQQNRQTPEQQRQNTEQQNRDRQLQQQRQEQQRTLPPTGRNEVNPTQPQNRPTQEQQNRERQQTEQQNRERQIQQQQKQQHDVTPPVQQRTLPPTGRDEVKTPQPEHRDVTPKRPQEVPKATPPAEQRREVPTPAQRPPTERTLPPTGRDDGHAAHVVRPPMQAPVEKPAAKPAQPAHPATPATRDGRDGKRDGDQQ